MPDLTAPAATQGRTCLDTGVYIANFKGCAACGGSRAAPLGVADRRVREEDDGEEVAFAHVCPHCRHVVAAHMYTFDVSVDAVGRPAHSAVVGIGAGAGAGGAGESAGAGAGVGAGAEEGVAVGPCEGAAAAPPPPSSVCTQTYSMTCELCGRGADEKRFALGALLRARVFSVSALSALLVALVEEVCECDWEYGGRLRMCVHVCASVCGCVWGWVGNVCRGVRIGFLEDDRGCGSVHCSLCRYEHYEIRIFC